MENSLGYLTKFSRDNARKNKQVQPKSIRNSENHRTANIYNRKGRNNWKQSIKY